jgi:hypothetical protein
MSKTVVIHQPDFMPYLGFFHRFLKADLFVILDTAQFVTGTSRSWMHRDKIKTPQGEKWISLSNKKCSLNTPLTEVYLSDNVDWRANHLNLYKQNYSKAAYFEEIYPYLVEIYNRPHERMMDFNLSTIQLLMKFFEIQIPYILASTLNVTTMRNERLVDILNAVGGTTYLSGVGARQYFDPAPFEKANIEVKWQEFNHPVYPQIHGDFIPFLSSIDMFFNCGIVRSREILRTCG